MAVYHYITSESRVKSKIGMDTSPTAQHAPRRHLWLTSAAGQGIIEMRKHKATAPAVDGGARRMW